MCTGYNTRIAHKSVSFCIDVVSRDVSVCTGLSSSYSAPSMSRQEIKTNLEVFSKYSSFYLSSALSYTWLQIKSTVWKLYQFSRHFIFTTLETAISTGNHKWKPRGLQKVTRFKQNLSYPPYLGTVHKVQRRQQKEIHDQLADPPPPSKRKPTVRWNYLYTYKVNAIFL